MKFKAKVRRWWTRCGTCGRSRKDPFTHVCVIVLDIPQVQKGK